MTALSRIDRLRAVARDADDPVAAMDAVSDLIAASPGLPAELPYDLTARVQALIAERARCPYQDSRSLQQLTAWL